MTGVAHIVARAVADDPHTLGVLALADAMGPPGVIGAEPASGGQGVDASTLAALDPTAVAVYHQCGAAPTLVGRLVERGAPLAVVHGATPPDHLARRDLQALAAAGALGLVTSGAAAARLVDVGFRRVVRVPPVVARERLLAVEASESTTHHLDLVLRGPLVVNVGSLATAAPSARLVQAHHVLRTYLLRSAHLAIAVPDSGATSEAAVRRVAREIWGLRLTDAWIHRLVAGERAALVRRARVFVTTDPACGDAGEALAAMAEGLPVVATADARAAELLGDGAVLLPPDATASLLAEAVTDLLEHEPRRARLAAAAVRAVAQFDPVRIAPIWRAALAA